MSNDRIVVEFDAETGKLIAGTAKVKSEIAKVGQAAKAQKSAIADLGKSVVAMGAAYVSVSAAVSLVNGAMEKYGNVADQAAASGFSPEFLQQVGNAAETCGGDINALTTAALKLSKEIVFGKEADASTQALKALGISLADLAGMSPDEQFNRVGKAIAEIQDPTQRSATAVAIFGKGAKDLIPTFLEINSGLSKNATLTKEQVKNIDDLGDAFTRTKQSILAATGALVSWAAEQLKQPKLEGVSPKNAGIVEMEERNARNREVSRKGALRRVIAGTAGGSAHGSKLSKEDEDDIKRMKDEQIRLDSEVAKNEQDTADQRHKNALDAMDDEQKLQALIKERNDLVAKYTGQESRLQKSELDKQLAAKDGEIQSLKSSMANAGTGTPAADGKTYAPGTLAAEKALEDYRNDPGIYNKDGSEKRVGLGRALKRKADNARLHETNRQARGIDASAPLAPGKNAAQDLADSAFGRNIKVTGHKFPSSLDSAKGAMGDGSNPKPKDDAGKQEGKTLDDLYRLHEKRLPERVAKP